MIFKSLKYLSITLFITSIFFSCNQKKQERETLNKPNILIIHVDDLGYNDLGLTGSKIYQTPNIDSLAMQSVRFENAYANYPRCVPSRYAMMTGGYPIQNRTVPDDGFEIGDISNDKNYIKHIEAAGYQTAYFGKWHLGTGASSPTGFGYDTSVGAGAAGSPISYFYPFNTPKHNWKTNKKPIVDMDTIGKKGDYLTDVLTDQVIKYIENRDKKKPFMAMLAFYAVHQPLEAKAKDVARNKKEISEFDFGDQPEYIKEGTGRTKMRQDNPVYAGMVENMDENVGKLLKVLDDLQIGDNTIVIFSSDHGGLSNDGYKKRHLATSNFPLRAGKGWLYDGGLKVPLFVKWKDHFQPRDEAASIVMLMDVFPTILDITSGEKLGTGGQSFLPILRNKEYWSNRTVFWHSPNARPKNTGDTKSSAIRVGDYKLINWYEEGRTELYNIKEDPFESQNLVQEMPDKTEALLTELNQWKSNF
ncbi:sulfatase [Gaetbulibacter sp. M240]|uniref:sulfatase n=1 Tax=Gaetbulibacter sp. M240 TaxID=3126511 RepID=UPI00374FBA0D